jgi:membrane protein YqaA with SNARE-associated domain
LSSTPRCSWRSTRSPSSRLREAALAPHRARDRRAREDPSCAVVAGGEAALGAPQLARGFGRGRVVQPVHAQRQSRPGQRALVAGRAGGIDRAQRQLMRARRVHVELVPRTARQGQCVGRAGGRHACIIDSGASGRRRTAAGGSLRRYHRGRGAAGTVSSERGPMRIFSLLYERMLTWAANRRAPAILATLATAESVIFPVPPDVMLIPMTLARPRNGWWYAALCTVASVFGGILGYLLGHYGFELVQPWIERAGYASAFEQARALYERWGVWIVFVAGFSPIPYKVFTIASGMLGMAFVPFLIGSAAGRGGRFFLVAGLIILGGERMERALRRHVETLGWLLVAAVVAGLAWAELR